MPDAKAIRAHRLWRWCRRWMPAEFRSRYADEMLCHHVDRSARRGTSPARFWGALLWDVLATGIAARHDARRRVRPRPTPASLVMPWQELRYAARRLGRQPAFSIGVVATLALAIGANLTMLSILDRLLLRPPPAVESPDHVRRLYVHGSTLFDPEPVYSSFLSYPDYQAMSEVGAFAGIAAHAPREMTLGAGVTARRLRAELVTASYFPLLGVRAAHGRLFREDEDRIDAADHVVVLSDALWRGAFGADPSVLGRVLTIGKGSYTVIGVAEPKFTGIELGAVDLWLPLHAAAAIESGTGWRQSAGWVWMSAIARIPDDDLPRVVAAEEEATARLQPARAELPKRRVEPRVVLSPLVAGRGPTPMSEATITRVLAALSGLVLLIGCANVVNLSLTRGLQRRRQFAVRRALGAGRARLALESLSETLLLTLAAVAIAAFIARAAAPAVLGLLLPDAAPSLWNVDRALLVAASITIAVVVLVGALPSYWASAIRPAEAMRDRSGLTGRGWLRPSLLFVQAAVSVFLLIGAGLFVRSLQRASAFDVGLATETLSVELELQDGTTFGGRLAPSAYAALERVRAHPRVRSAAVTSLVPFAGGWGLEVDVPGPANIEQQARGPFFVGAGAGYFETVGLPLRSGRVLTASDDRTGAELVAVVNEAMAQLAWSGEEAVGKCLLVGRGSETCTRVVGVVGNYLNEVTSDEATPLFYIAPHHPGIGFTAAAALLVRIEGAPGTTASTIAKLVRDASPDVRYVKVAPLAVRLEPQLRAWRVGAAALTAFGLLALLVAGAGLYAVLAFEVTQRRFELAIRAALGAKSGDLALAVVRRTLAFTMAGLAVGWGAALLAGQHAAQLLFEVRPTDPAIHGFALLALGVASAVAAAVPVRRAHSADPASAIREGAV